MEPNFGRPACSTPLTNRRHFMFQAPLSPIASVSSIDCDSEVEDFIQRGTEVKKSLIRRERKVFDRFEEHPLNDVFNFQCSPESSNSYNIPPPKLIMEASFNEKNTSPLHISSQNVCEQVPSLLTNVVPNYKEDSEIFWPIWSQDECINDPWTKAGQREYTLKRKSTLQKKVKKEKKKVSIISTIKRWIFRKCFRYKETLTMLSVRPNSKKFDIVAMPTKTRPCVLLPIQSEDNSLTILLRYRLWSPHTPTCDEQLLLLPQYSLRRHYSHTSTLWREDRSLTKLGIGVIATVDADLQEEGIQDNAQSMYRETDPIYDTVYEPAKCFHLLDIATISGSANTEIPSYIKFDQPCPPDTKEASFSSCCPIREENEDDTAALESRMKRRPNTVAEVKRRHSMFPVVSVTLQSSQNSSSHRQTALADHSANRSFQETNTSGKLQHIALLSREIDETTINKQTDLVRYRKNSLVQDLGKRKQERIDQPRLVTYSGTKDKAWTNERDDLRSSTYQGTPFRETNKLLSQRNIVHPITVATAGAYNPFEGTPFKSSTFPRVKSEKVTTFSRIRTSIQQVFNRLRTTKSYKLLSKDKTTNGSADLLDYQGQPFSESPSRESKLKHEKAKCVVRHIASRMADTSSKSISMASNDISHVVQYLPFDHNLIEMRMNIY